jgi:hypothetical protein
VTSIRCIVIQLNLSLSITAEPISPGFLLMARLPAWPRSTTHGVLWEPPIGSPDPLTLQPTCNSALLHMHSFTPTLRLCCMPQAAAVAAYMLLALYQPWRLLSGLQRIDTSHSTVSIIIPVSDCCQSLASEDGCCVIPSWTSTRSNGAKWHMQEWHLHSTAACLTSTCASALTWA